MKKDRRFVGYINFTEDVEEELMLLIEQVFHGIIYIGNKRFAGYGACKCIDTEIKRVCLMTNCEMYRRLMHFSLFCFPIR